MLPAVCPDMVAVLLGECRAPHPNPRSISKILALFEPTIQRTVSRYPSLWKKDFIQEGRIALLNAIGKFPMDAPPEKFSAYADISIRSKMVDFYRSTIERSPIIHTVDDPCDMQEGGEVSYSDITSSTITASLKIDFAYVFVESEMLKRGFTNKEINAFNLYFIQDYSVTRVAKELGISIPYASKIIKIAQQKAQRILTQ